MMTLKGVTKRRLLAVWVTALVLLGGEWVMAETARDILLRLAKTDGDVYGRVGNLRMFVNELLKPALVAEIAEPDRGNHVTEITRWVGAPVQVEARAARQSLRVRLEEYLFVIWAHRETAIPMDRPPREIVRLATRDVLSGAYVLGPDDKLVIGYQTPAIGKGVVTLVEDARVLKGTTAVACSYYRSPTSDDPGRAWMLVSLIEVLVHEEDVIIVMTESRPARFTPKCAGLMAARMRVPGASVEAAADQPVLARNVVFGENPDLSGLSDPLLSGCMWPIDDKDAVGIRELCAATVFTKEERQR